MSALALALSAVGGAGSSASELRAPLEPPGTPTRVVALGIPADELALALVPPDRIVAVDRFADDPDASNVVVEARAVARRVAVDAESILAREPDLVLLPAWAAPELEASLTRFGVATLRVGNATSLEGVRDNVERVAAALGRELEGARLLAELDAQVQRAQHRTRSLSRPTVLLHASSGYSPAASTLFESLVVIAGGRLLLAELGDEGLTPLSVEREMSLDPAVVIVDAYRADARARDLAGQPPFLRDPRFQHLTAVREGRVVSLPASLLLTTTHHVGRTIEALVEALHGPRGAS